MDADKEYSVYQHYVIVAVFPISYCIGFGDQSDSPTGRQAVCADGGLYSAFHLNCGYGWHGKDHVVSFYGIVGVSVRIFDAKAPNVLATPSSFKWLYACIQLWQHTGWNSIIYVAALSSVDVQLYDAAKVDGANRLQQMWNIELPSILPTIIILLILNVGHLLGASFEMIYLLQNDANIAASEVISTYVYKIGIKASNQISYSTAIGLFNNVVNFVILIAINAISNKVTQTSLF